MTSYGVGVRRRRRRRGELVAKQLQLSNYSVAIGAAPGVLVGNVTNKIAGTTLTLTDSDGERFALSGVALTAGSVATTSGQASPRIITLLEVQPNGVKQYSKVSIYLI